MASFLLDVLDFVSSPHVEQLLFIIYIQVLNKIFEIIGCILTLFVVEIIEYPIVVIIILDY